MSERQYWIRLSADRRSVDVVGPQETTAGRPRAPADDDYLPLVLDTTPHAQHPFGWCVVTVFGFEQRVLDFAGPHPNAEEQRIDMFGYVRDGQAVVALELRRGEVLSASCLTEEDVGEDAQAFAAGDLPTFSPESESEYREDLELSRFRARRAKGADVQKAAAFEVVKGIDTRYFIIGWLTQLRRVLDLARRDAQRLEAGETVRANHRVEVFAASELGVTKPSPVADRRGKRVLGAYYAVVHDPFEEVVEGAKMVIQGGEIPDWETFVYSNGRTVKFYARGGSGRRIDTRPIKIPVLVDIVRTLKEQERPRPLR